MDPITGLWNKISGIQNEGNALINVLNLTNQLNALDGGASAQNQQQQFGQPMQQQQGGQPIMQQQGFLQPPQIGQPMQLQQSFAQNPIQQIPFLLQGAQGQIQQQNFTQQPTTQQQPQQQQPQPPTQQPSSSLEGALVEALREGIAETNGEDDACRIRGIAKRVNGFAESISSIKNLGGMKKTEGAFDNQLEESGPFKNCVANLRRHMQPSKKPIAQ